MPRRYPERSVELADGKRNLELRREVYVLDLCSGVTSIQLVIKPTETG